jgi:hypothetical protein
MDVADPSPVSGRNETARGFDAGHSVDLREEAIEKSGSLTLAAIARLWQRQPHGYRA